jgi:hypothetical protein
MKTGTLMKTITANKGNSKITWACKVALCFTLLAAGLVKFTAIAQTTGQDSLKYWMLNTTNDHFWEPHCPTPSSLLDGYTLWLLRQKMTVEAYQTLLNNEINLDNGEVNKIQFTNYMPFIGKGNFHSMIGTQYGKFDIQSDSLNKTIQEVWLWTAWQFKYKRWNFDFTTENSFKGDESNLYAKTGNHSAIYVYVGYEFNGYWELIVLGCYDDQQLVGKSKKTIRPAIQARYQPSDKLKIMFGLPDIIAAEWTALSKTDIGMRFDMQKETRLFIRQRLSNTVSISVQYNRLWNYSIDTYFNNSIFNPDNNNEVTFNNISYLQPQLYAEVNLKLCKDVGFSIGSGYNFSNKMSLYNNEDKVYSGIRGKDNYFITCSMQFAQLK